MLTICSKFVVFLKMRPHFIEFPFYREKVASQKWLRSPFYRIPILSRAYCIRLSELQLDHVSIKLSKPIVLCYFRNGLRFPSEFIV